MNPTTLNVDPDPEFRPNLDTDPGLPVCRYRYSVLKEKNVINRFAFRGKNIFFKVAISYGYIHLRFLELTQPLR